MTLLPAPALDLLQRVPAKFRSRLYATVGIASDVAALTVLALPHASEFGVTVPSRWSAIAFAGAALLGHLAHVNTDTSGDPVPDAGSGDGLS